MKLPSLPIFYAVFLLLCLCLAQRAVGAQYLPEPDLSWKNLEAANHKATTFCIFQDSRGLVWIGTDSGLFLFDGASTRPAGATETGGLQIYSIVEADGNLLLGSNNGLLHYDFDTGTLREVMKGAPSEIRSLLLQDDTLWIGSLYGMFTLDIKTGKVEDRTAGLPHRSVYSIFRDSRGIVYAGTYDGLARWNPAQHRFVPVEFPVRSHHSFVNSLLESPDGQSIYVGGEGFLYDYRPSSESWDAVPSLMGSNVKSLAAARDGRLLIGTDNGLYELSEGTLRHFRHDSRDGRTLSDNEVWCVYTDRQDNVWAGHGRGFSVAAHSPGLRTVRLGLLTDSGEGNEIHSICRDSRGNLWLGGTNGVISLGRDGRIKWYRHGEGSSRLSHNRIRAIREDAEGHLWLATDNGLDRFDPDADNFDVFHIVDKNGSRSTNWVYSMEEDANHFYIGSYLSGLHFVDKGKFNSKGGTVEAEVSLNDDSAVINGHKVYLDNDLVNSMALDSRGNLWVILFRNGSLFRLSPDGRQMRYDIKGTAGSYPSHLVQDGKGHIWCGVTGGAVMIDRSGSLRTVRFPSSGSEEEVLAMAPVKGDVWVSTHANVWRIDGATLQPHLLPLPQGPYTAIYEDAAGGMVYLGGMDEVTEVDADALMHMPPDRNVRMALGIADDGTIIPLGQDGIRMPYGGRVSLAVSNLDYSPEALQRYEYKLAGNDVDTVGGWTVLPEGVNTIVLSALSMGTHRLLVRPVGWPYAPFVLPVKVAAPWYLSWWAIVVYVLMLGTMVVVTAVWMRRRRRRREAEDERRKALENVERKLTFLADISHDLKTPLSMILGPVSVMREKAKSPEEKRSLSVVYDNAVKLNSMIHRTLELNQLNADDESMMILSVFDVVEFCRNVFEGFRENNSQKKFVFHAQTPHIFIEADAVKFESVITNLLSNACKYSREDSTVSCGVRRVDDRVQIVVSDDGVGISEADQPLVFQRMFRAPATAKVKEGTGIGLYLIKKYLQMMDGEIELYSQPGQGTSFVVTLPTKEQPDATSIVSGEGASDGRPRILIVEDNPQISQFLADILGAQYCCLTADNGRTGLSLAASFLPDLIVTDELMPVMNGMEMARQVRKNPRLASIPIIMLTAKSDYLTESESARVGIDAFMAKPFEPDALMARIRQLLDSRASIRENVRIQAITEARPIEAESVPEKQLAQIAGIVEDNISDPDLNVSFVCEKSGIPAKQLYRLIKKHMAMSPLEYIRGVRLKKAALLLGQKRFTVAEVCYMVGFKTPSYFAKCFQEEYGVRPSEYGEQVR